MKKAVCILAALLMLLTGCTGKEKQSKYTATYLDVFDTVTTIVGVAQDQESFNRQAQAIHAQLLEYHRLFDIYNTYDGIANLKTVNDNAGIAPVQVDSRIIALLRSCKEYYALTDGKVNVAMGSVLRLWHEKRTQALSDPASAQLPDRASLEAAAQHRDIACVILDEEASTVYISDPLLQLDVGAVAKGWAVQQVAENAPEGLLISVGGNVCATGPKAPDDPWIIGIQDPAGDTGSYLRTLPLSTGSAVTSGSYQRTYEVNGKAYHHIIDPQSLMPSAYWCSVTVICDDSGLADALSTALFLLPLEQGQALAQKCGVQVLWLSSTGEEFMTPGLAELLK